VNETVYGQNKRVEFVARIIEDCQAKRVLDLGCGTGVKLTSLLADRFPETCFVGIDSDVASIAYATEVNRLANVHYYIDGTYYQDDPFDLVIASEVIEHVEDPVAFLISLIGYLAPDGKLILTLPNGFGPFELASFVETVMHLTGIYRALRKFKRILRPKTMQLLTSDTLAISPHINFFAYSQIRSLISACGLQIILYKPRTFLCGFGFDHLISSSELIYWNAQIADVLPPQLVSAWMFLVSPAKEPVVSIPFRRRHLARFRRYLNNKRWNL
jgi:SAM-dependent methyltransferase